MDDNELHYLTYDPDEIWNAMVTAYMEAGGDALYPGDEKEMLLRGVLQMFMQAFAGIDNALRMDTLRYAVRDYLDVYGEKRNCYRIQAVAARATVTITARETGYAETIPAGTPLTEDGETLYLLTADTALTGQAETVEAEVMCSIAGAGGNGLAAGAQMQFLTSYAGVESVYCTTAAGGGQDAEDDETYRERIRTYGLTSVTTGPADQYRAKAMAVSSEIVDAVALNGGEGHVDVYLLPKDPLNAGDITIAVQKALSAADVRPLTDIVSVSPGTRKIYELNIEYTAPEGSDLTDALAAAVETYQAWQDTKLGRAFNPDRLIALLYQAGCTRAVIAEGSSFDGLDAVYTEIAEREYCSGTISLAVMGDD